MTPVPHLQVPAFSITVNGFTCTDMLLMLEISQAPRAEPPQATVNQLSTKKLDVTAAAAQANPNSRVLT